MATSQEVKDGYSSTLQDLTCNSKPLISVLTMLAEENVSNAKEIVAAIEEHLAKVRTEVKLPVLYLVDCIIKNVGGPYTAIFCGNIVSLFCSVFQVVDEKTRTEMYKLRQTWNEVLPKGKLYELDVKTSQLDPAWPITAAPPNIHFNPKFLNPNAKISGSKDAKVSKPAVAANPTAVSESTLDMQHKLILKQKQLLELQQKKLELELLQTQVKLQEQMKKTNTNVDDLTKQKSKLLLKPEVAKQLLGDEKDDSAKAMIAQINQKRFPNSNPILAGQISNQKNNAMNISGGSVRPTIRDPRLLRQQHAVAPGAESTAVVVQPGAAKLQLDNISNSNNGNSHDNKVVSSKFGRESRFLENKDEHNTNNHTIQSKDKSLSRIPLKSKRSTSPVANKSKSSASRHKSSTSGSSSSLDSPKKSNRSSSKSPSKSSKYKKSSRDKRSGGKRERRSPSKDSKTRNYRRHRTMSISPDPDLKKSGPPEKRVNDGKHDKSSDSVKSATISKKRPSTDAIEAPNNKKNRAEIFDALFGTEDVDLRNMSATVATERPVTPPAPIISTKSEIAIEKENAIGSQETEIAPKLSLDVLRAKLANATNANKDKLQKNRLLLQAEQRKMLDKYSKKDDKIFVTPAEEENTKSGKMIKGPGNNIMCKLIAQIESQKLKESKRKENEENRNMMTQPISDDDFDSDIELKKPDVMTNLNNAHNQKTSRFEPRFPQMQVQPQLQPVQWKGKRGGFIGPRPRGRADPWIRPVHPGPMWKPPFLAPPVFEDDKSSEPMDMNSPPPLVQDDICMSHENIKSINIDGEPRDILFYGETAVAFMTPEDPREISFQDGQRRVSFDERNSFILTFNEAYRELMINGHCHRVRLGAPTREIYVDGKPYECIFGGPPVGIEIDRKLVMITIEGPPPQVKISTEQRTDLVAGKVSLIIDAKTIVPIYLDGRTQTFRVDGVANTLRFKDSLKTVLINEQPNNLEFGGLPKAVMVNGRKHFIRFSVLPKGIRPGFVNIRDMDGFKPSISDTEVSQDGFDAPPCDSLQQPMQPRARKSRFSDQSPERTPLNPVINLIQQPSFSNLDSLLSIASSALPTIPHMTSGSYQIEPPPVTMVPPISKTPVDSVMTNPITITSSLPQAQNTIPPVLNNSLNINELFQKLVATGIVTTLQSSTVAPTVTEVIAPQLSPNLPVMQIEETKPLKHEIQMKHVSFDDPSSLKVRQPGLIYHFYSGMQCSSCGMRFAQENTNVYSQHLDWHFRQNRRGKKNIRKASSRRWYYSITDWSNYEEIEDLEEREKCYFENQQKDQADGQNDDNDGEIEIPSVPTDSNDPDPKCEVCQEKFEQFYNEEKEEWHLKMAIRVDDRTYHPLCYEDYQVTLANTTADESIANTTEPDIEMKEELESGIPGLDIKMDIDELPIPVDTVGSRTNSPFSVADALKSNGDDIQEDAPENVIETTEETTHEPNNTEEDDDVILNEVEPERIILDDYELDEHGLIPGVIVKQEPVDDGFTDIENFHLGEEKVKTEDTNSQDESFVDIGQVIEPNAEESAPTASKESEDESVTGDGEPTVATPISIATLLTSSTQPQDQSSELLPDGNNDTINSVTTPLSNISVSPQLSSNETSIITAVPTIDGNLDCNAGAPVQPVPTGGISGKIKINISKPLPVIAPKENKDISSDVDNNIEPTDPTQPLPPGEEPVQLYLKPALQGIDLKQLPPVNKGSELTGLCSIM